jgi:hypothetical protein
MYDHNGLELTPMAETMNSYKMTNVNLTRKKFAAYARATAKHAKEMSMFDIAYFDDPRDAAFIAQEFAKKFSKETVRSMVTDGTFKETAKEFAQNLEIPEWKYQAEGFSIEELLNGGYEEYKKNYAATAKDALVEAIKVLGKKTPDLKTSKIIIEKVENLYKTGMNYRDAAYIIMEKM